MSTNPKKISNSLDDLAKILADDIDNEVLKTIMDKQNAAIWTKNNTHSFDDLYPYGGLRPDPTRELEIVKKNMVHLADRMSKLETELIRKNAYIEKLCSSLMLIIHDPKKLEQLEGLKEQYEKYVMLGSMIYGEDFADILKGLR